MTKQLSFLALLFGPLLLQAAAGEVAEPAPAPPRSRAIFPVRGQTNEGWAVWIERKLVGSGYERAQRFEQKLYIRGPADSAPRLLVTQTSSGGIHYWLGPNGLLAVQPVGGGPRVYFPGRGEPHLLEAPQPAKTNDYYNPPFWGLDRCWFFGHVLVYESRRYGGAEYLVGLFRIDAAKKTASSGRICLEVSDPRETLVRSAQVAGDRILFVGTHLLWENAGWDNSIFPNEVQGKWRTKELRAFDLETGQMMSGSEIPPALLARHKESLEKVFGQVVGERKRLR